MDLLQESYIEEKSSSYRSIVISASRRLAEEKNKKKKQKEKTVAFDLWYRLICYSKIGHWWSLIAKARSKTYAKK